MKGNILRSIVAVIVGAAVSIALSVGTDKVMHATGIFPEYGRMMSDGLFALATAYRTAYGVFGAYLTARLAPNRPMMHALILGALGLVATIGGAVATWNKMPELGPRWYPIALVVLAIPPAWLGGRLRVAQLNRSVHG